jgi:hypothetical protein
MPRGHLDPLTTLADILRAERNPAKEIARALADASPRQAKRIVCTGRVPGALRRHLIAWLKHLKERNAARIAALDQEIARLEIEEAEAGAAARALEVARPDDRSPPRPAGGPDPHPLSAEAR